VDPVNQRLLSCRSGRYQFALVPSDGFPGFPVVLISWKIDLRRENICWLLLLETSILACLLLLICFCSLSSGKLKLSDVLPDFHLGRRQKRIFRVEICTLYFVRQRNDAGRYFVLYFTTTVLI